jgi:hypothetical protein
MLRHDTAHKESLDEGTSRLEFGAQPPGTGSSASGQLLLHFCPRKFGNRRQRRLRRIQTQTKIGV